MSPSILPSLLTVGYWPPHLQVKTASACSGSATAPKCGATATTKITASPSSSTAREDCWPHPDDGELRLYGPAPEFKLLAKRSAPGGNNPFSARFSPDASLIAVGFDDSTKVNILSGDDLRFIYAPDTSQVDNGSLISVAWSTDGSRLYAAGRFNLPKSDINADRRLAPGRPRHAPVLVRKHHHYHGPSSTCRWPAGVWGGRSRLGCARHPGKASDRRRSSHSRSSRLTSPSFASPVTVAA